MNKQCSNCSNCIACGEGDFICAEHNGEEDPKLVIDNYIPTENYNSCETKLWKE